MEARQAGYPGPSGGAPPPLAARRPMRPAPYDRPDRYAGPRGGGGSAIAAGYDSYASPRDRYSTASAGRFKG